MTTESKRDAKLIQYLNEAYATERRLEIALEAHIAMTPRADYKKRLREHLKETKGHARSVGRRVKQLGGEAETMAVPGPDALAKGAGAAQAAVQRAAAVAQGGLHLVRGTGDQERMLKNARTEYQDEAEEIATYRAIEALAKAVGDKETAKLARDIGRDEKRMSDFLAKLIGELALDVVHDEIPASEIAGPAARRTAVKRPATSGRSAAAKRSSSARSASAKRSGTGRSAGTGRSTATSRSKKTTTARKTTGARKTAASGGRAKRS
jgi:ferritin-like metal-binding protein YciE